MAPTMNTVHLGPNPLDTRGLCLLSLDGGGVRGLSTLFILRDIMSQLKREMNCTHLKPCDIFDLIGGTSTGGLIAIMLGRLEMDIDDCITAYSELMTSVFGEKMNQVPLDWKGTIRPQFDSSKLKSAIQHVIVGAGLEPDAPMDDGALRRCRSFVCTTAKDTLQVTRLRSYRVSNEDNIPATICEAALATSAATGYFGTAFIGNRAFVDGAFGANNPVEEVEEEAADIWCTASRELKPLVKCFLSVGTGYPARVPMDDNMMKFVSKTLVRLATKPESTERRFMARWSNECRNKRIFRFNVEQGLQGIHMTDHQKRSLIESATQDYLHHSIQKSRVRDCVLNLTDKKEKSGLDLDLAIQEYRGQLFHQKFLRSTLVSSPPLKRPCWVVPLERNAKFVDREYVTKVKRILFSDKNPERVGIVGLGGVGKTQIALELVYQVRETFPGCAVFWVSAIDITSIEHAYRDIAHQLGIADFDPQKEDIKVVVQRHLSQSYCGRWLLIFDNLDDLSILHDEKSNEAGDHLRDILPHNEQGVVLFTTRSNKVAHQLSSSEIVTITEMDEHKATHMFQNLLIKKNLLNDQNATRNILTRLTFLPLAIVQAASFLNENDTEISGYLELLDGQEQDVIDLLSEEFEDEGRYKNSRNPVATTWLTSFTQIRKHSQLAANYLSFIACINSNEIPVSILPRASNLEREKAIGLLHSYSFIRTFQDTSYLTMHRLVHLATRNWLRSTYSLRAWQLYTLRIVDMQFPAPNDNLPKEWRAALPHALQIISLTSDELASEEKAHLLSVVSSCYQWGGEYKTAERFRSHAVSLLEDMFGKNDQRTLSCRESLANVYLFVGDYQKSDHLLRELLNAHMNISGSNSMQVVGVQEKLASLHRLKDELTEAEEMCKPVVRFAIKNFDPSDARFINAINGMTMIYLRQGRLHDTLELAKLHLNICRNIHGMDSHYTRSAMESLADLYLDQWELEKAEALYDQSQECSRRINGPEHPNVLRNMHQMAILYKFQGRYSEAVSLLTECVRLRKKVLPYHEYTQASSDLLEQWTSPRTLFDWMRVHSTRLEKSNDILKRKMKYPRVKVYGGLHVRKEPRDNSFICEIREMLHLRPICDSVSTDNSTLVDRTDSEGKPKPENLVV